MKVRGDLPPSNAFTVEAQPQKPGVALVRFYENVGRAEDYVLQNFDQLLRKAKAADAQGDPIHREPTMAELKAENEKLHGQVANLESQLTDTQMALCDIYEMVGGAAQ